MTQPTIDQLTAERDLWRARALAMLEVLNAVDYMFECESANTVGDFRRTRTQADLRWLRAYAGLRAEFNAFRKFTEGGVPLDWTVAGEESGPQGIVIEEGDVPF